jgi:hypothetical protein
MKHNKAKGRGSSKKSLVVQKLENISKSIFRNYYKQITELIGNSHGIYALYDGDDLYYVGKSTDLKKRVKQHLKDRHIASWTHFSLYLVRSAERIGEIESLLIRIANPKGNRKTYRTSQKGSSLLKELREMIKQRQKEELNEMFGEGLRKRPSDKSRVSKLKSLVGLVSKKTSLYRTYKGREYRALLTPRGKIKLGGKVYLTPTAAAKAIVKRSAVNGWKFWYIKDMNGEWIRLSDFR